MVMSLRNGTARNGNQMSRLASCEGLATALLPLVLQDRFESPLQVQLSNPNGGITTDLKGFANLLVGPAIGCFEQGMRSGKRFGIGFACMDERLQRGAIGFGQRDRNGMLQGGLLAFPSVSHSRQFQFGLTTSIMQRRNTLSENQQGVHAVSDSILQTVVEEKSKPNLSAYSLYSEPMMQLVPASSSRSWMTNTRKHFANRCLPLLVANQAGWFLLNSHTFRVTWTGHEDISSLTIEYLSDSELHFASSHFGHGILTLTIPYLFRTSPGYNLLVRGPANWPKEGVYPLEGLVETDWSTATFTMNWKVSRPNFPITFERNEPLCMIVPQKRGELENFSTEILSIASQSDIEQGYYHWSKSRREFLTELDIPGSEASKRVWQKDYFKGLSPTGRHIPDHQLKLKLQSFEQKGKYCSEQPVRAERVE